MRQLLLVSTSTVHGTGYLDHCEAEVRELFAGRDSVLFVPYALYDPDRYAATVRSRFEQMGFGLESLHEQSSPAAAVENAAGVFIGGGNTFRLIDALQRDGILEIIRDKVAAGMPYMGTSAGSNVACLTIKTTNDMPILQPQSFEALALVPFQINPHYQDPEPGSAHMGETRETRIREFHEENDTPVVGLREGAMLQVDGEGVTLRGLAGARLFCRGREPEEFLPGDRLDFLLQQS
jgi:dipeptidase E